MLTNIFEESGQNKNYDRKDKQSNPVSLIHKHKRSSDEIDIEKAEKEVWQGIKLESKLESAISHYRLAIEYDQECAKAYYLSNVLKKIREIRQRSNSCDGKKDRSNQANYIFHTTNVGFVQGMTI